MTKFKIEKGVPVAPEARGGVVYPFSQMEIGDSFFVSELADKSKHMSTVRRAACAWSSRHNVKMTARKVEGGLRVWRVA